jgi:hypothetical protein
LLILFADLSIKNSNESNPLDWSGINPSMIRQRDSDG